MQQKHQQKPLTQFKLAFAKLPVQQKLQLLMFIFESNGHVPTFSTED